MTSDPTEGSPQPPRKRSPVIWFAAGLLLLFAALAAWLVWSRMHNNAAASQEQQRLQALIDKGRVLAAELASIKPPDAPNCPPGQSLKTFAPGSVLPSAPASSASAPATQTSSSTLPLTGAAAVLSDFVLAQRLEKVTAMVLVDGGNVWGGGTGFFIAPNLLVTNRHVVERPNSRLMLVSKSLGSVRRATLLHITQDQQIGAPDFALLRMEDGSAPSVLDVGPDVGKLAPVVAAGYPGVVIKGDPNFQRLMQGDTSASPDLNLTQGAVQSLQNGPTGTPLVVHTASIAEGNSGGPLVDACGRLVGVNTFISVDQKQSSKINYAIRSQSMSSFLSSAGASARVDARTCRARE